MSTLVTDRFMNMYLFVQRLEDTNEVTYEDLSDVIGKHAFSRV